MSGARPTAPDRSRRVRPSAAGPAPSIRGGGTLPPRTFLLTLTPRALPPFPTGARMTDATRPLADRLGAENLRLLENIGVRLTVEVGRTEMTIRDLLRLSEGSVVELDRLAGDPLDVLVNGTPIAKGEVVMVGERFGIRFGQIIEPEKRAESL
nr:flagellar protein FliN [Cereibacter sphaeroides]CAA74716.1 flagellar switch protein [Cereibacter sphaeroides]